MLLRPKRASGSSRRDLQFSPDQTWLRGAKSFNFVDETQEVINIYETNSEENGSDNGGDNHRPTDSASPAERLNCHPHAVPSQEWNPPQPEEIEDSDLSRVEWALSLCSPTRDDLPTCPALKSLAMCPRSLAQLCALLNAGNLLDYGSISVDSLGASIQAQDDIQWPTESHASQRTWPLKDKHEAQLFCHWVRNMAPLFDLCDHERHFATVVPQRATTCPPLLNALLAASAKHSSCLGLINSLEADKYYQESLGTIIPVLSSHAVVRDENLLAAIVILRYIEEVDIPFSPAGPQSHLIGTRAFLSARDRNRTFGKLGKAVFWLALRQEIFMALIHSRSVHPDLLIEDIVSFSGPSDCDCDYANRVIVQAALCLQYCFGEKEQQLPAWEELNDSLQRWYAERPWQFYPISAEDNEDRFLPDSKYISDAVVTGLQHYYLARLILVAHNPNAPRLGPSRKMHQEEIDREMRGIVRTICGMAKANPHTIPAYVPASVSIVIAGDRFAHRDEQTILYKILEKAGEELAWPTMTVQKEMRSVWGW
ncbi:hypothetical protein NUW58_g1824 [Xylaria curta]|uniref:Uncharacterized protein n=1 Tax=Xylaria curta TaxID=42375 RepID=A0ACC1PL12_9PEZI|nr:hypothetical protein NUW58_g1824 [Xylaria curta]